MIELKGTRWVDLSHIQESDMPADPALQLPELTYFSRVGNDSQIHNLEVVGTAPILGRTWTLPSTYAMSGALWRL